jgi:hypothetical protein
VNVRSRVGDLVVWNLRTDHAGAATLLRFIPWLYVERRNIGAWQPRYLVPIDRPVSMSIPRVLIADEEPKRVALFFTLGLDDAHRARYTAYLKTRMYAVDLWKQSQYSPDVWESARGKSIKVIDMGAEVRRQLATGDTSLGENIEYAAIPY